MAGTQRTWGFRFSAMDAAILLLGAAGPVLLWPVDRNLALLFPFVVLHFFLFCNVFRVRRKPELIWAGAFLLNFAAWQVSGHFHWLGVCALQLPLTAWLLWQETRRPWYHGIAARRWNNRLEEYLRGEI